MKLEASKEWGRSIRKALLKSSGGGQPLITVTSVRTRIDRVDEGFVDGCECSGIAGIQSGKRV